MRKNGSGSGSPGTGDDLLRGTTLRIYRFMYKEGRPMGLHEIQRALGLSSASIPQYHINKLISAGLVKEQEDGGGYFVDRLVFENMNQDQEIVDPVPDNVHDFFLYNARYSVHAAQAGSSDPPFSLRRLDQSGGNFHLRVASIQNPQEEEFNLILLH